MDLYRPPIYVFAYILYRNVFVESIGNTPIKLSDNSLHDNFLIVVNIKNTLNTRHIIYRFNSYDKSHTFTPIKPFLIEKVTRNDRVLWDSADYGNEYSNKVYVGYNEDGNRVFRVYFPGIVPEHRPLRVEPPLEAVRAKFPPEAVRVQPPKETKPPEPKRVEPKITPKFITLDVKIMESTDEIDYHYDPDTDTHTFTPKYPHVINVVNKGSKNVYTYEEGDYPERVVVYPGSDGRPILRVVFPQDTLGEGGVLPKYDEILPKDLKVLPKEPVPEPIPLKERISPVPGVCIEPSIVEPVKKVEPIKDVKGIELKIDNTNGTNYSHRVNDCNVGIFSANPEYGFSVVKDSFSTIWRAKDSSEYADYVDVGSHGFCGKEVTIFMLNRKVVRFQKVTPICLWTQVDDYDEFGGCCGSSCKFSLCCLLTCGLSQLIS